MPKYNLVLWFVPGGPSNIWQPHQTIADHVVTDKASLDLLDHSKALVCGSYYQVDLYLNSKTTNALVAGGVLYGANNPKEDLAYGALGKGHNPWKYLTTPACPLPVHTQVTPKFAHGTYTCNTTTYTVDGANVLTLTGQKGVVWTITKGSDTETLAAGAGFNAEPPYGVGTYTITGADASSSDLIDVTPVTTTATFVSKDSVECTAPPVVVHPVGPTTTCNTVTVPGTKQPGDQPPYTDPETGAVSTFGTYSADAGGYYVTDMTLKGLHTFKVIFIASANFVIADPGPGDTYTVQTTPDGVTTYTIWTPKPVACPLTIIATPPAPAKIPATCTANGSLPPLQGGDGYTAAYIPNPGANPAPGVYKLVYTTVTGKSFKDSLTVSYDIPVDAKLTTGCPTTTPPPTNPPVTNPPVNNPPANNHPSGTTPVKLAYTGVDVTLPVTGGIMLVIAGLLIAFRRRIFGFFARTPRHAKV